ncbi:MAG: septum formation initiator family protein [Acidobacteria bacterium]|nr:septum formation initiator family protein [Acidobacteriota bacterium]
MSNRGLPPDDASADRAPRKIGAARRSARRHRVRRITGFLLLFVASVLIVDGLVGEKGLLAIIQARRESVALAARLDHLRAENDRLREEARRLKEDPDAIEEIARRELGLIRPGEKVFIVKDQTPQDRDKKK